MADTDNENVEELEEIRKKLLKNGIFFSLGWIVFVLGLATPSLLGYGIFKPPFILMLIGWGLIGFPKLLIFLRAGFGAVFASPNATYEVVTKDSTGRVVGGDGGMQSSMQNIVMKMVLLAIIYAVGGLISAIHLIILTVRYIVIRISTKAKEVSKPGGFAIIIFIIVMFFAAFVIAGIVYNVGIYQTTSVSAETIATVISDDAKIFPDLSPMTQEISILPKGTTVTIISVNKRFPAWTQIMYEGKKVWIESKDIHSETSYIPIVQGTATVKDDLVSLRSEPLQNSSVIKQLQKGETIILTGKVEGSFSEVTHNGDTGWIVTSYLKIDKK